MYRLLHLLFLALALGPFAPIAQGGVARLELPGEAHVVGRVLSLGQFAAIQCDDPQLQERLAAFDLGYAPAPGFSRLITAERLAPLLQQAFPGETLRLAGELSTRIWPKTEVISVERQKEVAERALTQATQGRELLFTALGALQELTVPAGAEPALLKAQPVTTRLASGAVEVTLEVHTDGALYRALRLPYQVEEWQWVAVLVRDVAPGELLSAQHFKLERLASQPNQPQALTVEMASGSITSRSLRAGSPVSPQDVHRPLAVLSGNSLFVEVRRGPVSARVLATAVDSGSIGDRIRIQLASNGREMRAVVASRDLAVVSLDPASGAESGSPLLR